MALSTPTLMHDGWILAVDETFAVAQSTLADFTSSAIDCRGWDELELAVTIDSTGDPVGNLYVQQSRSAASGFGSICLANVGTDIATVTHDPGDRAVAIADPAADTVVSIKLTDLSSYTRVFYDRTSGGDAAGVAVTYTLRRRRWAGKS